MLFSTCSVNSINLIFLPSRMAIDTVATVVKGAGQHSGPQGTIVEAVKQKKDKNSNCSFGLGVIQKLR